MYSQSKCSNWAAYDPYLGEISQIRPDQEPTAEIVLSHDISIKVLERPLHEAFLRPYTIRDIEEVLATIPLKFLVGLSRILLLGGTKKQQQTLESFRFGTYYNNAMVCLNAFPRKMMQFSPQQVPPHRLQEYFRAGAVCLHKGNREFIEFNEQSLKTFYLRDVLVHEVGHHVDWLRRQHWNKITEEFAEWFTREYGFDDAHKRRLPC
jgi:hypothetical protein